MTTSEQDVLRFDVAVHDPEAVGVAQRVGDFPRNLEGVPQGKLFLSGEPVTQRLALDVRHNVVEQPARLTRVEKGKNVRVIQPGGDRDLAEEPLGAEGRCQLRLEHLQRDGAIVLQVVGPEDRGHPAPADLVAQAVARSQGSVQKLDNHYCLGAVVPGHSTMWTLIHRSRGGGYRRPYDQS